MIYNWFRPNMFRELMGNRYAKRLLETKGQDDTILEAEVNRILWWLRLKRYFRQYFPRLVINILFTTIVKSEKEPSEVTKRFAEKQIEKDKEAAKNDRA